MRITMRWTRSPSAARTQLNREEGRWRRGDIMQLRGQRLCYESCRVRKEIMKQCLNDFQAAGHVRIFQFDSFIGSIFLIWCWNCVNRTIWGRLTSLYCSVVSTQGTGQHNILSYISQNYCLNLRIVLLTSLIPWCPVMGTQLSSTVLPHSLVWSIDDWSVSDAKDEGKMRGPRRQLVLLLTWPSLASVSPSLQQQLFPPPVSWRRSTWLASVFCLFCFVDFFFPF